MHLVVYMETRVYSRNSAFYSNPFFVYSRNVSWSMKIHKYTSYFEVHQGTVWFCWKAPFVSFPVLHIPTGPLFFWPCLTHGTTVVDCCLGFTCINASIIDYVGVPKFRAIPIFSRTPGLQAVGVGLKIGYAIPSQSKSYPSSHFLAGIHTCYPFLDTHFDFHVVGLKYKKPPQITSKLPSCYTYVYIYI